MDMNDIRSLSTVFAFLAFVGVCVWAYSKKSKPGFDEAANQLFDEEEERMHRATVQESNKS